MSKLSMAAEFWQYFRQRKRYWLLPVVLVLGLLGMLLIFAQTSALAPFIYALF